MPRASIATMASPRGIGQRTLVPRLLLVLPGSSRCEPPWGAGAVGAGCGAGCQLAAPKAACEPATVGTNGCWVGAAPATVTVGEPSWISEARHGGEECGHTSRYRWLRYH